MKRLFAFAVVISLMGIGCARYTAPESHIRQAPVDTTALIIRIFNYHEVAVVAYLDEIGVKQRMRIGVITPFHEGLFVLHTADVAAMREFYVTVEPVDARVPPYRTGVIQRPVAQLTLVYVTVGTPRGPRDTVFAV